MGAFIPSVLKPSTGPTAPVIPPTAPVIPPTVASPVYPSSGEKEATLAEFNDYAASGKMLPMKDKAVTDFFSYISKYQLTLKQGAA
jgi:hypothetical protein